MTRCVVTSTAASGHINKRTPSAFSATLVGVGCSGSDPLWTQGGGMAAMVNAATGNTPTFIKSTIPGAPITWNRDNNPGFGQPWVFNDMTPYNVIHLGDNPGLAGLQDGIALNQWAQKAWATGNGGAGTEILLWSLQPILQSTASAQRTWFNGAAARYDAAQDYANARRPGTQRLVRQIPGLQLFQKFFEDQEAGLAPGGSPTWFRDLYPVSGDTFHIGSKGTYAVHIINAACIYGLDPKTLPANTATPFADLTLAEATYIRNTVSDVVKAFERSGVNTSAWT